MNEPIFIETVDVNYVSKFLNCSPKTVLEKAGLGELPGAKIGKSWVFKLSDVLKYFNDEIERQTLTRKNRYASQTPHTRRSYESPSITKKRDGYPDLAPYRAQLKP
tara:strand:+ start:1472 stop:1789 length:318 start_codon:yes stop_codon:yes gene_type:complete